MTFVLTIVIGIFMAAVAFVYSKLRVPNNLKAIPSPPAIYWLINLLLDKPIDVAINETSGEQLKKTKIQRFWRDGKWGVTISGVESAKKLFNDTVTFPKILPTDVAPDSLFSKFLGINLVFTNHAEWRRHRNILNPPFKKQFKPSLFGDCAKQFFGLIDGKFKGEEVDVFKYMQRITMDAMGKGIMGTDFQSVTNENVFFINAYNKVMREIAKPSYFIISFIDAPWFPLRKPAFEAVHQLDEYLQEIIEGKKNELSNESLLSENNQVDADIVTLMVKASLSGEVKFTDKEIRDNMMIFLLAGHDTTAFALSGFLHFMAIYPEIQETVRKEIMDVMGLKDFYRGEAEDCPMPTIEQTKKFDYMVAVIKETLRIYPSISLLPERKNTRDVEMEGYLIPKGTTIELDIYSMHHDPDNFYEPEQFNPNRFLDTKDPSLADAKPKSSYAWTPFGGGTRSCIGMNFSLLEQKVVLAMIFLRYKVSYQKDHPFANGVPLVLSPSSILSPKDLFLKFDLL